MNASRLIDRFRTLAAEPMLGAGCTALRLQRFFEAGREDLSLAKLFEAHWDAVSILAEANRKPVPGALYGVWAAQIPGTALTLARAERGYVLDGSKSFCTGSGIVDRALIVVTSPEDQLIDLDLRENAADIQFDGSFWKTSSFAATKTANAVFHSALLKAPDLICDPGWYPCRAGFWHGALGPAACWAGGAAGLVDYARSQTRNDSHTLAHLGAMNAAVWAMQTCLRAAGDEIDLDPADVEAGQSRALTVRHLIEQSCSEVLRRFARAYGPYPLAADEEIGRRYAELDLYLRQSHAERDLEKLGRSLRPL